MLITTGSQQGLDLVGKVLIDPGSAVAVESPTYLGALQAFAPYEPEFVAVDGDDDGPLPERWTLGARRALPLPAAQLPEPERPLHAGERAAWRWSTRRRPPGLPLVEDNPYGDLWFDSRRRRRWPRAGARARSTWARSPRCWRPGLRLGYVVRRRRSYPKLLQAKQAADLHTPGFNQRVVHEVIKDGFLRQHVPTIRARYKRPARRDGARRWHATCRRAARWNTPVGGMFFWVELPPGSTPRRCCRAPSTPAWPTCRARLLRRTAPRMPTRCA